MSVQVETVTGQPSQLSVSWQPPLTPNGLLTGYTAYCIESPDDEVYGSGPPSVFPFQNITSNATVLGSESSTVVDGLDPYTTYDCFVTAYTLIGEGEPSYAASGTTDESSKLISLPPYKM